MTVHFHDNKNLRYLAFRIQWCVIFSVRFIFILNFCYFVIKNVRTCSSVFSFMIVLLKLRKGS